MKSEEVYDTWKEEKSQIDIRQDFADEVMNQVYQYARKKTKRLLDVQWLIDLISAHPLAKAGLIAAGAIAGFVRVAFVVCMFLSS